MPPATATRKVVKLLLSICLPLLVVTVAPAAIAPPRLLQLCNDDDEFAFVQFILLNRTIIKYKFVNSFIDDTHDGLLLFC